jgi:hypothetical protein
MQEALGLRLRSWWQCKVLSSLLSLSSVVRSRFHLALKSIFGGEKTLAIKSFSKIYLLQHGRLMPILPETR